MGKFAINLQQSKSQDEISSLLGISQRAGVGEEARSIVERAKKGTFSLLRSTLDIIQRSNFAIASGFKNVVDSDPESTFTGGLRTGITGETKNVFSDVLTEIGFRPETFIGRVSKGVVGFTLDVLLDPTTYLTLGVGAGIKVLAKGSIKASTLTRLGAKTLKGQQKLVQSLNKGLSIEEARRLAGETILNLTKKNPELAKLWIDKGGIKFFGNTLLSSERIGNVLKFIPGMKTIDRVTEPLRNRTFSLFSRKFDPEFGKLPDEFLQLEQRYRDLAHVKPRETVKIFTNIAKANKLTAQEADIVTSAIEAGTKIADPRLENARSLIQNELKGFLKGEHARGIKTGEITNYVPHILVENKPKNLPFKLPPVIASKPGFTKGRKIEGTISEINEQYGKDFFNTNIIEAASVRGLASTKAQLNADFLQEMAENFGAKANSAPTNYVDTGIKALEEFKFHPALAKRITSFRKGLINDEASTKLLRDFDKILNIWKASVTSIFPAFHGRNAISNVFLNFMDIGATAFSPGKNALATSMMLKNRQLQKLESVSLGIGKTAKDAQIKILEINKQVVLTDFFGTEWNVGALRALAKRNNIAFTGEFFASDIPTTIEGISKISKAKKVLPVFQDFYGFKKGREIGSAIEGQARMLNFMTNLQKTGDPITAAERTKRFLFDYQNLTDFEKGFMKRIMPFYTFSRKNLEVQLVEGLKQPGKIATQAKMFNTVGDILSNGDQVSDEEIRTLPDWMQKGLLININRNGSDLSFLNNLGLPLEESLGIENKKVINMLSPMIKFPVEKITGRNLFFEKDTKDVTNATAFQFAPKIIQDFIGYKEVPLTDKTGNDYIWYVSTKPDRMHTLVNIPPTSRIWGIMNQLGKANVPKNIKILSQITGIKPRSFNIEKEAEKREKEITRELEDLLIREGIGAEFKNFFVPKGKKKELGI